MKIISTLTAIQQNYSTSADKLRILEKLLEDMNQQRFSEELLNECPDLAKKVIENEKLKYRTNILKRSIDECKKKNDLHDINENNSTKQAKKNKKDSEVSYVKILDYGDSFLAQFKDLFSNHVKKIFPEIDDPPIVILETNNPKFGDYQFNSAMALSKKFASMGVKISPRDLATKITENFPKLQLIEKIEVSGAGFINLFLNRNEIGRRIAEIYKNGINLPKIEKRRVIVDFSSPNIAKEMHVGHLRSTIIGDSICRLFERMDLDVVRLNHVGDWGTQFGMLIAHVQDCFPDYLNESPSIGNLHSFYKESKKRFDNDVEFKERAYKCVVKLQNHEPDIIKAWNLICDVSRIANDKVYDRLDVTIIERGESFYHSRMVKLVEELDEINALIEADGRKILFATGFDVPLTIVKSDGGFTYATSDLTALKHRLFEENADWIIYVVDAGQSLHIDTFFAAGQDLGYYSPKEKRVEHVGFGLVLGEDKKKFKTRSGETIRLTDLLDEGVKRSKAKMETKRVEKSSTYENITNEEFERAYHAVAYNCIKYADLCQNRNSDYVFSFDKMLDDRGNTAVYLLYAYARIRCIFCCKGVSKGFGYNSKIPMLHEPDNAITSKKCSIFRKAGASRIDLLNYLENLHKSSEPLPLTHEAEFKLAKQILKFSDCILAVLDNLLMNQLCEFVYNLATTFHDFYKECYVIHQDQDGKIQLFYNRLILCEAAADVMAMCFNILGLSVVEKM